MGLKPYPHAMSLLPDPCRNSWKPEHGIETIVSDIQDDAILFVEIAGSRMMGLKLLQVFRHMSSSMRQVLSA